jgi:hypothetical protein
MALFQECSLKCARKVLDTADIVREAIFHQTKYKHSRSDGKDSLSWMTPESRSALGVELSFSFDDPANTG